MPTGTATYRKSAREMHAWLVFVVMCISPVQLVAAQIPTLSAKDATTTTATTTATHPELPPAYRPPTSSKENRFSSPPTKYGGPDVQPPVYRAPKPAHAVQQPPTVFLTPSVAADTANTVSPIPDLKGSQDDIPIYQFPDIRSQPKTRITRESKPTPVTKSSQPPTSTVPRKASPGPHPRVQRRPRTIFRLLQHQPSVEDREGDKPIEVRTGATEVYPVLSQTDDAQAEDLHDRASLNSSRQNAEGLGGFPPMNGDSRVQGFANSAAAGGALEGKPLNPPSVVRDRRGIAVDQLVPANTHPPTVAGGHDGFGSIKDRSRNDGTMSPLPAGERPGEGQTKTDRYSSNDLCHVNCACAHCISPFSPDPDFSAAPYDPDWEWDVYDGKWFNCKQSPWVEWGRGIYPPGPVPPSPHFLGVTNPVTTSFLVYGDYRTAVSYNDVGNNDKTVWAHRLNLDIDFKFTATERIHAFWGPLDRGVQATRWEANDDEITFVDEFDEDFDTLFFEGDLGYIWGGFTDQYAPFDLPFVFGRFPLFLQNGIWFNEIIEGFAFTIPARHLRFPVISNYEITYFFGFDDVASPAFGDDDNAANIYGAHGFFEMFEGYLELGHAYLDDRSGQGLSYRNLGVSFTRRYFQRVSNAVRVLVSSGQRLRGGGRQTADGTLLLIENAWVSRNPNYFVPYFNMFAGFGRPQSAARLIDNVLVNTGINFETDFLTGYPTLDASANDTWGGAIGLNWMGPDFSWQWIVELAMLQTFGNQANRIAPGDQYAIGTRYQIPINYAWILRMDAMYGLLDDAEDLTGARIELRWKF